MLRLLTLIKIELIKIYSKPRTYIGFITIGILIPLIMFLIRKFGFSLPQYYLRTLSQNFVMEGNLVNGYLVSYYLMSILWIHFPFFIILIAGDSFAGEDLHGTFRILLTRPVSRIQVLTAKYLSTFIYTASIVWFLGIVSLGSGALLLGAGDLFVFDRGILILSQNEAIQRFAIAYSLAVVVQIIVASLAILLSTISENPIGPIIGTYAVIIVSIILSVLKIDALEVVRPYLFTSYFDVFFAPFADPIPWDKIWSNLIALIKFGGLFFLLSVIRFVRKDVCS
jgi:ABC-2 type transport system permease protein